MIKNARYDFPSRRYLVLLGHRQDAAKHRNTRRAIAKTVEAIVGNRTVDALLRESAQPRGDVGAMILKSMEADGVFACDDVPSQVIPSGQRTELIESYELAKFMADFDQACCHTGFLLLEIGYNRIVDWMITVEDSRGGTIGQAKLVFRVQHPRLHEACKEASAKLRAAFPSWFGETPSEPAKPEKPIQDISQFGTTFCTLHRVTTVGNFCSACEHEAAQARVPVSKAAKPAQAAPDVTRLVTAGGEGGVE